jgi:hypothetical protein
MLRPVKLHLILTGRMAGQTTSGVFSGLSIERKDQLPCRLDLVIICGRFRHRFGVRFPWTMARLAASTGHHTCRCRRGVDRLTELRAMVGMTCDASVGSNKVLWIPRGCFPSDCEILIRRGLFLRNRKIQCRA